MNMQKNQTLARRTAALLSAIAASSLLGLPALAGGLNRDAVRILDQAQAPSDNNQMQCTSTIQSSGPSSNSASSNSATGTSSIATPDASATGAAQVPNQADPRTGATSSDQFVGSTTDGSTASVSTNTNASSRADNSYTSNASNQNASNQNSAYGDVLSQGGATSGGFASQQVAAANNPDAYATIRSRYTSNDPRANSNYGNRDNATNSGNSMRSDSMNQSSVQSSRIAAGTTIAQCPSEMMPRSSTPENR